MYSIKQYYTYSWYSVNNIVLGVNISSIYEFKKQLIKPKSKSGLRKEYMSKSLNDPSELNLLIIYVFK